MTARQRHLVAYVIGAFDGALLAYIAVAVERRPFSFLWWVPLGALVGLALVVMLFPPPRRRDG